MSSNPVQSACNHTTHLFYDILCPNSSLTEKVTTVVCGGLLLIGGIFTVSAISKHLFTPSYPEIPEVGKEAIQSTLDCLEEHPEITPYVFQDRLQPINPQIARLRNLYWNVHYEAYNEAMSRHANNPWEQEEVCQSAVALMKTAYTIGCLTLQDLEAFTQQNQMSYAKALTSYNSYQQYTFYYCTRVYHWMRGMAFYKEVEIKRENNSSAGGGIKCRAATHIDHPEVVSEAYARLFYEKGTPHNLCNELYNDYCDRVRAYVKEDDLRRADTRHVRWTRKDTKEGHQRYNDILNGVKTVDDEPKIPMFYHTPDTLPRQ